MGRGVQTQQRTPTDTEDLREERSVPSQAAGMAWACTVPTDTVGGTSVLVTPLLTHWQRWLSTLADLHHHLSSLSELEEGRHVPETFQRLERPTQGFLAKAGRR